MAWTAGTVAYTHAHTDLYMFLIDCSFASDEINILRMVILTAKSVQMKKVYVN